MENGFYRFLDSDLNEVEYYQVIDMGYKSLKEFIFMV